MLSEFISLLSFGTVFIVPKVLLFLLICFIVKKRTIHDKATLILGGLTLICWGYFAYYFLSLKKSEFTYPFKVWLELLSWFLVPPFYIPIYGAIRISRAKKLGQSTKRKINLTIVFEIVSIVLLIAFVLIGKIKV